MLERTRSGSTSSSSPASRTWKDSNLKDIAIPADFAGVYLDVDTGNWNTNINAPQTGWDINPFFGGAALWNSPGFQPVRSGTGATDAVLNLASGTMVDGSSVFSTFVQGPGGQNPGGPGYGASETHLGNGVGPFVAGTERYFGFRMTGGNYGWMRVVLTNNTGRALIKEWAYDEWFSESKFLLRIGPGPDDRRVGRSCLLSITSTRPLGSSVRGPPEGIDGRPAPESPPARSPAGLG